MLESCEKLNNQAIALAAEGEFTEAIACFMRALTIETENYLLWYNLGITYRDAGNIEQAMEAMTNALRLNPDDSEIIESLALLTYTSGDIDKALMYCSRGLRRNKANIHLWNTLGIIYFKQGYFKGASEAFEQALLFNPYYDDALYNLRDTYDELGNVAGMEECQRKLDSIRQKGTKTIL